jgi:rhamnulokinase
LLNKEGQIIGLPYAYRDHRTDHSMQDFFEILAQKGDLPVVLEFSLCSSTRCSSFSASAKKNIRVGSGRKFPFYTDVLNYLFTGVKKIEIYPHCQHFTITETGKSSLGTETFLKQPVFRFR